jgi:hypothetical protein
MKKADKDIDPWPVYRLERLGGEMCFVEATCPGSLRLWSVPGDPEPVIDETPRSGKAYFVPTLDKDGVSVLSIESDAWSDEFGEPDIDANLKRGFSAVAVRVRGEGETLYPIHISAFSSPLATIRAWSAFSPGDVVVIAGWFHTGKSRLGKRVNMADYEITDSKSPTPKEVSFEYYELDDQPLIRGFAEAAMQQALRGGSVDKIDYLSDWSASIIEHIEKRGIPTDKVLVVATNIPIFGPLPLHWWCVRKRDSYPRYGFRNAEERAFFIEYRDYLKCFFRALPAVTLPEQK